jgi:hypothetical protein
MIEPVGYDDQGWPILPGRRGRRGDRGRAPTSRELLHARRYVEPLTRLLRNSLPNEYAECMRPWLAEVPADYADPDGPGVTVWLPRHVLITPATRQVITACVRQALGLDSLDASWSESGPEPCGTFRVRRQPPARVLWADIEPHAVAAADTAPVLGLDRHGRPVTVDLESDSPHILAVAGSGGGKSQLVKVLLMQALHRGAGVIILDFKRSSHAWAKDITGVIYCRSVEEIHHALIMVGDEAERRNVAGDDPDADIGPRIFLCAEEMNATMARLQTYWANIRDKSDPKTSPAVQAFRDILFMGRSALVNVIGIAQMGSVRSLGGPEARENFATRCMARYSVNSWKMLAPEVWPAPARTSIVGRWQVVKHGQATETQVAYATDDQAREWVAAGSHASLSHLGRESAPALPSGNEPDVSQVEGVTLRAALDQAPDLAPSLIALRKASHRDGFPAPVGKAGAAQLYDLAELAEWRRRREAARVANR